MNLFDTLESVSSRPAPFSSYTAETLWNDDHISKQMLRFHLDQNTDLASRKIAFIDESVAWMAERFHIGPGARIADFGCGPGLYASRLARLGARIVRGAPASMRIEGTVAQWEDWASMAFPESGPYVVPRAAAIV